MVWTIFPAIASRIKYPFQLLVPIPIQDFLHLGHRRALPTREKRPAGTPEKAIAFYASVEIQITPFALSADPIWRCNSNAALRAAAMASDPLPAKRIPRLLLINSPPCLFRPTFNTSSKLPP